MTIAGALKLAIDLVKSPTRGWVVVICLYGLVDDFSGLKTLEQTQRPEVRCTDFCYNLQTAAVTNLTQWSVLVEALLYELASPDSESVAQIPRGLGVD